MNQTDFFNFTPHVVSLSDTRVFQKVYEILVEDSLESPDDASAHRPVSSVPKYNLIRQLAYDVIAKASKRKRCSDCPVCGSVMTIYKRSLSLGNIYALHQIREKVNGAVGVPVHIAELKISGGDFIKTKHWGFIVQKFSTQDGSSLGWALTHKGMSFLEGMLGVPKSIYIFKSRFLGWEPSRFRLITTESPKNKNSFKLDEVLPSAGDQIVLNTNRTEM